MANVKISDLPAVTSVAADDTVAIVQGGTTKKASFAAKWEKSGEQVHAGHTSANTLNVTSDASVSGNLSIGGTVSASGAASFNILTASGSVTTSDLVRHYQGAGPNHAQSPAFFNENDLWSTGVARFGQVATFEGSAQAPDSISNSTTTANLVKTAHGLSEGDNIVVTSALPAAYSGNFQISNVSANGFNYTMGSDPGGSATTVGTFRYVESLDPNGAIMLGRNIDAQNHSVMRFFRVDSSGNVRPAGEKARIGFDASDQLTVMQGAVDTPGVIFTGTGGIVTKGANSAASTHVFGSAVTMNSTLTAGGAATFNGPVTITGATVSASATFQNALQPSFLAINSTTETSVIGNNSTVTVEFDTEIFDQGGDFNNTTDTFTAPVTGKYFLQASLRISSITAAADRMIIEIVTSNRTYTTDVTRTNSFGSTEDAHINAVADMDAGDTAIIRINLIGEASDVAAIEGAASPITWFSGCLLA